MSLNFSKGNSNSALLIIIISVVTSVFLSIGVNLTFFAEQEYNEERLGRYVEDNPEIFIEAMNSYYQAQQQDRLKSRSKRLADKKAQVYEEKLDPRVGDADAKVKIVEFFDYNCGYCKKAFVNLERLLRDDLDIEIIFKELPILGASSLIKAKASVAANMLDSSKFFEVHRALMMGGRITSLEQAADLIYKIGYNRDDLLELMQSAEVKEFLEQNRALAQELGVNGTPAFIIGDEFIDGAVPYETLKLKVKELD